MGKFSGVLIACDVDGTLVENGVLSDENAKAINYFIDEGGLFTVATGRTPDHIKEHYMPELKVNVPMICVNGTVIADEETHEILWEQKMPAVYGEMIKLSREIIAPERIFLYTFSETVQVEEQIPKDEFYKILIITKTTDSAFP